METALAHSFGRGRGDLVGGRRHHRWSTMGRRRGAAPPWSPWAIWPKGLEIRGWDWFAKLVLAQSGAGGVQNSLALNRHARARPGPSIPRWRARMAYVHMFTIDPMSTGYAAIHIGSIPT